MMESQTPSSDPQPNDYIYQFATPVFSGRKEDGSLFAARASGLYLSKDNGQSWELAYSSLKTSEVLPTVAIALSPDFSHEPTVFAGLNGAILRSNDGGKNWQNCRMPTPPPAISALVASPHYSEDGIVFAGTNEDGILNSNNRGDSWVSWNFGLLDLNILCLTISPNFATDETLYAGVESGLFRSTNGGRAWKEVPLPIGFDAVLSLALSPQFAQDQTLFAGTENNGLLCSQDRGKSWQLSAVMTRDQPVNSILLSPTSPNFEEILILHGGKPLATKDGGATWEPWQEEKLSGRIVVALLSPQDFKQDLLVGFDDGSIAWI